ncbi:MAG: SRPBCC family protein [Nannocystales bacterium]
MANVEIHETIHADAERVWAVIGDYNNIHVFHPFVKRAEQLCELGRGVGAKRRCHLGNGSSQDEEVVEWTEGESIRVRSDDAALVDDVVGGMRVRALDAHRSEVTIDMQYKPRWGVFGRLIDVLVFRLLFRAILGKVGRSLRQHIESTLSRMPVDALPLRE